MGINSKTHFEYGVCVIVYMFYPCFSFGNGSGIVRECFGNASLCHLYGVFRVLMTLDVISFCPTFGFQYFFFCVLGTLGMDNIYKLFSQTGRK